jgi:thiamine pyridinylase
VHMRIKLGTVAFVLLAGGVSTAGCAEPVSTVPVRGPAPEVHLASPTTLTVALYPYVPRIQQFQGVIAAAWALVQPNVSLTWATGWDGGYSMNPDPSYDVFVFDALNLSYFQAQGFLYPLTPAQVPNLPDIVPWAANGVTSQSQVLAIPQLGCGDFIFYKASDSAIAQAATVSALVSAISSCSYYTATPTSGPVGLSEDLSGGTTDASTYVESVHEQTGQWPVPLPTDPSQINPTAAAAVQSTVGIASFANVLYSNDSAPYQRATWFGQGLGRAYIGFLESMSAITNPAVLPTMAFKPMPWSNNPVGAQAPLFYSDVVGIGPATVGRGTNALAIQLANLMTSTAVIVQSFGAWNGQGPQYLMPVSRSALAALAGQYLTYQQMSTVLAGLQPILFNLGPQSKPWLTSMKSSMQSMVLANPVCYTDFAAPPIGNNQQAQSICPPVCQSHNGWSGQWTNTPSGSVCGCDVPSASAMSTPKR